MSEIHHAYWTVLRRQAAWCERFGKGKEPEILTTWTGYAWNPIENKLYPAGPDEHYRRRVLITSPTFLGAPYFVSQRVMPLIEHGAATLTEYTLTDLPVLNQPGFVWFARPVPLPSDCENSGGLYGFSWAGIYNGDTIGSDYPGPYTKCSSHPAADKICPDRVGVTFYVEDNIDKELEAAPKTLIEWGKGESIDEIQKRHDTYISADPVQRARRQVKLQIAASFWLFIQQRVLGVERISPPPGITKKIRRDTKQNLRTSDVNVVVLRERHTLRVQNGELHPVDWSCQWLVRGHWRYQGINSPVWVRPYIKGPEDKPFREPKPVVYAVAR